jgi:hypothetical protein
MFRADSFVLAAVLRHLFKKMLYDQGGELALQEISQKKPCIKNRVAPEVEQRVLSLAPEYPTYWQMRVFNELRKEGILVSPGGIRSIWLRHELQTMECRLKSLEEEVAKTGGVLTEFQKQAMEKARTARQNDINSVDTAHPGYLLGQDNNKRLPMMLSFVQYRSEPALFLVIRSTAPTVNAHPFSIIK